jgi:hypothetical protein
MHMCADRMMVRYIIPLLCCHSDILASHHFPCFTKSKQGSGHVSESLENRPMSAACFRNKKDRKITDVCAPSASRNAAVMAGMWKRLDTTDNVPISGEVEDDRRSSYEKAKGGINHHLPLLSLTFSTTPSSSKLKVLVDDFMFRKEVDSIVCLRARARLMFPLPRKLFLRLLSPTKLIRPILPHAENLHRKRIRQPLIPSNIRVKVVPRVIRIVEL